MLKKLMLLAMAVGALVALAAPAAASAAHQWTDDGAPIAEGTEASESYEGRLQFTSSSPPLPVHSTFGCDVTTTVVATGTENGTGHAEVTAFNPTTSTCTGTGVFTGCKLINDVSNPSWTVDINAANTPSFAGDLTITGPVTITNTYAEGCPAGGGSELTFNNITANTTSNATGIQSISISGPATNGFTVASGTVNAESVGDLGVDYE
jgi:hypothetical protein